MKYVFYVTNHLHFYMALSIQEHLQLARSACYYITKLDSHYQHKKLAPEAFIDYSGLRQLCSHNLLQVRQLLLMPLIRYLFNRIFEKKVAKHEAFTLVTCGISCHITELLSRYKNCQAIWFFEEGTSTYLSDFSKEQFSPFPRSRFQRVKYWYMEHILKFYCPLGTFRSFRYPKSLVEPKNLPQRLPGYKYALHNRSLLKPKEYRRLLQSAYFKKISHTYNANVAFQTFSLYKEAFKGAIFNNHIIKFYRDEAHPLPVPEDATLFIMQPLVEGGQITVAILRKIWQRILTHIATRRFYLKFHPRNNEAIQEIMLTAARQADKNIALIDQEISLEQLFLRRHNLQIYGFFSSSMIYARHFGAGTVTSFCDFFTRAELARAFDVPLDCQRALRTSMEKAGVVFVPPEQLV